MNELSTSPMVWYEGLARYQQQGAAHVLATVVAVNGSAPRALQAKMIITPESIVDTLGGGGLEHDVVKTARKLLNGEIEPTVSKKIKPKDTKTSSDDSKDSNDTTESTATPAVRRDAVYTKHYPLGAKLAQCCGGSVTVMFECFNVTPPMSILVFGAGHVASALVTILAELPCQVDWVDSRPEMFDRYLMSKPHPNQSNHAQPQSAASQSAFYQLPAHIRPHVSDDPVDFVRPFIERGGQRFILIMTHDHSVDFELVRTALDTMLASQQATEHPVIDSSSAEDNRPHKSTTPYLGCIGSATKAKRFRDRLIGRGYSEKTVSTLVMPVGLPCGGKEPMAVAVSIVAQLLQQYHQMSH